MNKKRVTSLLLISLLVLSTFVPAFAEDYAFKNVDTGVVYELFDYAEDDSKIVEIGTNLHKFAVEIDGKYYSAEDINAKMAADEKLRIEQAVVGLEPIDKPAEGDLKVVEVSAINLRELKVTFNNPVDAKSATDVSNYYVWMTKESDGALATHSVLALGGDNADTDPSWVAELSADKMSVTLSSRDGQKLTDAKSVAGAPGGLGLTLNEEYKVQVRNVKDANGKYTDVQEEGEILRDTVRPTVKVETTTVKDGDLVLSFSEPVKSIVAAGVKVYVNGNEVAVANITDVVSTLEVADHTEAVIDVSSAGLNLANGTHKVAVVGATDLNDNLLSNNATELTFTVADPDAPAQLPVPKVESVEQFADNAFKIVFNTTNVAVAAADTGVITIKEGAYAAGAYADIVLGGADFVAAASSTMDSVVAVEVGVDPTKPVSATNKAHHTEWLVYLTGNANEAASELSYRNANVMTKQIIVDKFFNDGSTATGATARVQDANEPSGTKTTKSLSFKKDLAAPTVDEVAGHRTAADTIVVTFADGPFEGDGNGLVDVQARSIEIKYVDQNGVTRSQGITTTPATDVSSIDLKITEPTMLKDGKLIPGATYSIELPDGVVVDATEDLGTSVELQLLDGTHPFVKKTVTYKVPGELDPIIGVPQTTQGMINSVKDLTGANTYQTAVTTALPNLKDNQIVVQFIGDIDAATLTNTANYKLNGATLPAGSTVEYKIANIDGVAGDDTFALITLPEDSVAFTGSYDFRVENVANRDGNKMIAVEDIIQLTDNRAPVAESVSVHDSNTVKVRFNENVTLVAAVAGSPDASEIAAAAKNFKITANGKVLAVVDIAGYGTDELTLRLADNFDEDGSLDVPVIVEIKADNNGNMFVIDAAGNKANSKTVTK